MHRSCLFASLLLPGIAAAQPLIGPYVSLGAGTNFQQNEIVGPAPFIGFERDGVYKFHPGFAGQASLGYGLGRGLRLEIEGDFLDNVVRGFQFSGSDVPRRAGGVEQKYGGFVNALYDIDLGLPITPYLGVGAGGQIVDQRNVNQSTYFPPPIFNPPPPGFQREPRDQSVGGFAYQGIAGFSVPLAFVPGLSFTTEYRFIGLLDPLPAFQRTVTRNELSFGPSPQPQTVYANVNRHFENNYNHTILLGVRYAFDRPVPPPPPAPPAPIAAPAPQPTRTYLVFFDWDRADLTPRARQIIAEAASASTRVQTTRIEVNGYTDLSGTAAYNLRLSVRRARSVEAELVRDGVPAGAIAVHGFGEADPLVPTAPGVREPQNRRVEIILR